MVADSQISLELKEGDLPFVVGFKVEETVALDATAFDAVYFVHCQHRVFSRRMTVVSEVIVSRRNEQFLYIHCEGRLKVCYSGWFKSLFFKSSYVLEVFALY